jgi:hypothetical protein
MKQIVGSQKRIDTMLSHSDARKYGMHDGGARASMPRSRGWSNALAVMPSSGRGPEQRKSRRLFPLILLACALIISTVLVAADFQSANTTLVVQVGGQLAVPVDLNQSFAISPYLAGSNIFPKAGTSSQDQKGSGFMSYDPQVVQGLRSAGIKLLRFPGGNWGEQHTLSTEQLNDFSALLNQVGAEGFIQAQLSDPQDATLVPLETRASRAALLVDYMNNRQSIQRSGTNANAPFHVIKYWSIGNEPDLLINPDTGKRYTVGEYTQAFIAYSLAMHQKDPNIKVFGPEISQPPGKNGPRDATGELWMEGFLQGVSAYERTHALPFHLLDGVSFHLYPFNDAWQDSDKLLNNAAEWDNVLPSLRQSILQQFGEDLPIAITEINTNPGKAVPPQNLAALWWADTLGKLMSNQVEYVAFFSTEGVDAPYPLFTRADLKETALLRTMQLFAHLQSNLIPIQGAQGPVSMYATQNSDHTTVSLLFINKTNRSQHIRVHPYSLLPFGIWHSVDPTIEGYSMVVLTLHRSHTNEAFSFSNSEDAQQIVPKVQHLVCGNNTYSTGSTFAC